VCFRKGERGRERVREREREREIKGRIIESSFTTTIAT
jgi:hypothetical protein